MTVTSYNGEEVMAAMVGWVMRDKHPTAYITTGHGESTSQTMTVMLACAGYNVQAINLRGLTLDEELSLTEDPDTLLIISNPTSDFGRASASSDVRDEIEKLETYLGRGGHLYVSIDPYVSHKQILNLTSFLENYGISIATSTPDGVTLRNIVKDSSNAITLDGYTVVAGFAESDVAGKIKATAEKYGSGKILVREAAAIVCSEGERGSAYPLLVSSDSSVCEVGGTVVDNSGSYCVAAGATVPVEGAAPGGIFVISTAYIAASDAVNTDGYSNKDFVYAVLDEIMNAKTPPYGCTSIVYDTGTLEGLTMGTANIYTAIAIVIPALIALAGVVIITKRKNR
jgi:hypothetical protein